MLSTEVCHSCFMMWSDALHKGIKRHELAGGVSRVILMMFGKGRLRLQWKLVVHTLYDVKVI